MNVFSSGSMLRSSSGRTIVAASIVLEPDLSTRYCGKPREWNVPPLSNDPHSYELSARLNLSTEELDWKNRLSVEFGSLMLTVGGLNRVSLSAPENATT